MRRGVLLLLLVAACKRDESVVCPDPAASAPIAKNAATPMTTIDVPLPKAASFDGTQRILAVAIDATGKTAIDGLPIAGDDAITDAARKARKADPDVKAVILADKAATHGRVIEVLDRLKLGGISKIAFGVSALPAPATP